MSFNNQPIGVFDSGVGGVTVWKELVKLLPNESIIYYADSANCPYGPRSDKEIIDLSRKNVDFLISKGCKLIVVACNTATAAAIDYLRENYDIPFIGMEPAIKPAALHSKTGNIGVLATAGTFNGRLFKQTSRKFTDGINVHIKVGEGLVELVESGKINTKEAEDLIMSYINPMLENNVDQIVLGCTHYPFFKPIIERLVHGSVKIIDPAPAIAIQTRNQLENFSVLSEENNHPNYLFYTNGDTDILERILSENTDVDYQVIQIVE